MNHVVAPKTPTRRRGIALVVTVSVLALATILLLAMFSVTESEFKSTQSYAAGQSARNLGDSAVNIVISQIQAGSRQAAGTSGREFHATQPGAVRRYTENGAFLSGHKLYSDSRMTEVTLGAAGEIAFAQDVPPADWDSTENDGRYVDLNEPAITADASGNVRVAFPIVDPRAFMPDPNSPGNPLVEGFSYFDKLQSTGGNLNGVVLPTGGGDGNTLRVPMPVEWMYVLKDGSLGTLNDQRRFVGTTGQEPTAENPIVGRVAFWTDDESCKININTASEPTYWGTPTTFHERAHQWAERPPTINEFQRFPGHPATVSLSTVLFPNKDLDQYGKPTAEATRIVEMKEAIYRIMPKINNGGSVAGTVPYAPDDLDRAQAERVGITESIRERLYATLDELLFSEQLNGSVRSRNDLQVNGVQLITPELLERSRFFLTANSRSPEFSMLGVPRVSMWPVADESLGQDRRSIYDKLIAFCATIDSQRDANEPQTPKTYYFRRKDAHSTSTDVNLPRNQRLLEYLHDLMGATYPRGTLGSGSNFVAKYGDQDARQILISIFDYIRATNLYDSYQAPKVTALINMNGKGAIDIYKQKDIISPPGNPQGNAYKSYTEPRYITRRTDDNRGHSGEIPDTDVANGAFPGHGQVSPSHWRVGTQTYMGYARSVSISEAALHFICTADGKNDDNSYRIWVKSGTDWVKSTDPAHKSGGRTAAKIDFNLENAWTQTRSKSMNGATPEVPEEDDYWYSNYPPFPATGRYGTSTTAPNNDPRNPRNHPGYNPENWNVTLDPDVPLLENEKRVQAALHLELFSPAVGWTKLVPELTFVLNGNAVSAITLNGRSLWSTTANLVVKTERSVFESWDANPVGGAASFRNLAEERRVKGVRRMSNDPGYITAAGGSEHADVLNLDLISSFITIPRDQLMEFEVPQPIQLDIYDDHNWQGKEPMQTVMLQFPSGVNRVRPPDLVVVSTEKRRIVNSDGSIYTQRAVDSPRWWTFNWGGCLRRYTGSAARYLLDGSVSERTDFAGINARACGRLRNDSSGLGDNTMVASTKFTGGNMPASRTIIFAKDPGNVIKNDFTNPDNPALHYGTDVIRSIIPKYGDYRIVAARRNVPGTMWQKHPLWDAQDVPMAHNLTSYYSNREPGFDRSGQAAVADDPSKRLVQIATALGAYGAAYIPDMPHTAEASAAAARYRDFDNGVGPTRDGAYINKPDEGNFSCLHFWIANGVRLMRNAYFFDSWMSQAGDEPYFTPNRMIASPVMFGSLPTGVWGGQPGPQSDAGVQGVPWRTLLFRPDVTYPSGGAAHAGNVVPRDHYLLDLFYMPVVEPYAISEPLSVAGRINVNYQMVPFTHIRRATGLHAVLKGELMNAVPKKDAGQYLAMNNSGTWPQKFWEENRQDTSIPSAQIKYWHRKINIPETLKQLDDRFNMSNNAPADGKGLLRSATQICEVHLIPSDATGGATYTNRNVNTGVMGNDTTRKQEMGRFWDAHGLTGDNSRERPYVNIYPRLTSRSNTFRVHVRSQAIRKARSTDPAIFEPGSDAILSEYRGSTLIERYIDPNDTRIPEYADGSNPLSKDSLDTFYRFRVIENKRFVP